jgi:acyl-CoA synthetase (AMP-forming)/AMP-acid ligase II
MALGGLDVWSEGGEPLIELVVRWAGEIPDVPAYTFVDYGTDRAGHRTTLSWAQAHQRACAMAARLRRSAGRGDRVALLLPQGLDYLTTMLGALYAGLVAVPLFAPDLPGHADRLVRAYADADPAVAVTTSGCLAHVRAFLADHDLPGPCDLVVADTVEPAHWQWEQVHLDDVAYLQYTSGSTREPAGVQISHRNITVNARQLWVRFGVGPQRSMVIVSWLPLFHDMGLIATLAAPIVHGDHAQFTDPMAFIRHPARWLAMISECPGEEVFTTAPNFAYEYCLSRTQDKAALDLSGLRWALNGAEPVRQGTLDRFTTAFAEAGLRPGTLCPCYGLAEATVFVTAACEDVPPVVLTVDARELSHGRVRACAPGTVPTVGLVSCGRPAGQYVAVVDPGTCRELPDDRIGEIWVHGPNVARGYWRRPERSRETFGGCLTGPAAGLPREPWLRTGDLGVIHDGELYVTGRIKDLIIVDGRNHFPQDIEVTVQEAHPAIRPDHVAAFAIAGEATERLVVVAERSPRARLDESDPREVHQAVRGAVAAAHQLATYDFVLVRPGGVPRTSSGKVARHACKQRYLTGELRSLAAGSDTTGEGGA